MSFFDEYHYTFQMIIPDKTHEDLVQVRDQLLENADLDNRPIVASTREDYMTITIEEDTEYPDERLPYAIMVAKVALRDCGINQYIFIRAHATPTDGQEMLDIHNQVIKELPNNDRINLTDVMLREELAD